MSSLVNKIKDKVHHTKDSDTSASVSKGQHLAAVLHEKGERLKVEHRPTPHPGPNELLIHVHAVALNPLDVYQRDMGSFVAEYPAVIGSDVAGTVLAVGSSVPAGSGFKPGVRVAANAPAFFEQGKPDYGGMQERLIVPAGYACILPDNIGFKEASMLPIAVATTLAGWYTIGLQRNTKVSEADKKGLLVWGAASSNGSAAVQSAKIMGFTVYATASERNFEMVKSLGADKVFDYKKENVEQDIIAAAKKDGITFDIGYDAVGQVKSCMEILSSLKSPGTTARLAEAVPTNIVESSKMADVTATFIAAPEDAEERAEHTHYVFNGWLKEKLASGEFVPSPRVKVIEGGLEGLNTALDTLKEGKVSGEKIVLEI